MLENLQTYFSFAFVRYAFIVGVLIAVCSSLLGVTLVLKRLSFRLRVSVNSNLVNKSNI